MRVMTDTSPLPAPISAEKTSADKQQAARHHGWDESWLGVFLLMLVAAVLGGLLSRLWPGGDGLLSTPASELTDRVAALDARVIQLTNAQSAAPAEDMKAIRARITLLEDRVKAAETILASQPTAGVVAALPSGVPATAGVFQTDANAKLDAALKQVQELQGRIATLEISSKMTAAPGVTMGGAPAAGAVIAQTEIQTLKDSLAKSTDTLTALSSRMDELQTRVGITADPAPLVAGVRAELDLVSGRVAKIEQADLAGSAKRAALGAAVASLARAANGGQPFKSELVVVQSLAPDEAAIRPLLTFAEKGAPVLSSLHTTFAARADAALKAERDAAAGQGLDRLWSGVTSVVTVRATGTPTGKDTASVLARAETKLKAGDLRAAAAEVRTLQGAANTSIAPWLQSADQRVALDSAMSALSARVVESLTKSAAAAPVAPTISPAPVATP
jgi:hypothetical protein